MVAQDDQPRATTASIDRRVERLELLQAETDRKVVALDVKVDYIKQFMELRFSTLEATVGASNAKLDAFMSKIDALIAEAQKQQGDLEATVLGRSVSKRLTALEAKADAAEKVLDGARGFSYVATRYLMPAFAVVISVVALAVRLGAQ